MNEIIEDIIREKREMAAEIRAHLSDVPARREDQLLEADSLDREADRLEAAVDRERRQYERLHGCFWDKSAVQCIIRRMRDSRDDLARAYPETAKELDYFANELIRARCDRTPGNAAAIREALEALVAYWDWGGYDAMRESRLKDMARAALSAPARQCDVGTAEEQDARFGEFCVMRRTGSCAGCSGSVGSFTVANGIRECALVWAQMPYTAEEGAE